MSPSGDASVAASSPAAVLSVLGNASVLCSTARRLNVLKAPELLTVNLAVTDVGMALSMYPLSIASAFSHAWLGGDASCLYYGLMGMIFSICSIMTLAVMGMIRFLVAGSPPRKGEVFIIYFYYYYEFINQSPASCQINHA